MIDRLRQLAIFAKTIDHGSFRGAARELRLSPSVVSHHITQLEEKLGVAILYRSTRKLALTGEGERLLAATRKMLEAVEGELLELSASANEPSGEIRLTAPSVLSQSPLCDAIAALSMSYPRIKLSLDFSDLRRELIKDGFDIAIRMGIKGENTATSRVLFKVERKLVASCDYIAKRPLVSEPKQLLDWDWLELTPVRNIPMSFHRVGHNPVTIKPDTHMSSNDAQAVYRLSRAGAGLAVIPEFLATDDLAAGRVGCVLPDWELDPAHVIAVWPPNAPKNGLIRLVLNEISGSVGKLEKG